MGIFNNKKSILDSMIKTPVNEWDETKVTYVLPKQTTVKPDFKKAGQEKPEIEIAVTPPEVIEEVNIAEVFSSPVVPDEVPEAQAPVPSVEETVQEIAVEPEETLIPIEPEEIAKEEIVKRLQIRVEDPEGVNMDVDDSDKPVAVHAIRVEDEETPEFLPRLMPKHLNVTYLQEFPEVIVLKPEQYFNLISLTTIKSLHDLHRSLTNMTQEEWDRHVGDNRNEFADWIEHNFSNLELVSKAWKCRSPKELRELLSD